MVPEIPDTNLKLLGLALLEGGTREFRGPRDNPRILEYFGETGADWVDDDETAWCSSFACAMADRGGLCNPRSIRARNWLKLDPSQGRHITQVCDLVPGDVVVLWRGSPTAATGHVGIYLHGDKSGGSKWLWLLGGNQGNMVKPRRYSAEQFLGGRRLQLDPNS